MGDSHESDVSEVLQSLQSLESSKWHLHGSDSDTTGQRALRDIALSMGTEMVGLVRRLYQSEQAHQALNDWVISERSAGGQMPAPPKECLPRAGRTIADNFEPVLTQVRTTIEDDVGAQAVFKKTVFSRMSNPLGEDHPYVPEAKFHADGDVAAASETVFELYHAAKVPGEDRDAPEFSKARWRKIPGVLHPPTTNRPPQTRGHRYDWQFEVADPKALTEDGWYKKVFETPLKDSFTSDFEATWVTISHDCRVRLALEFGPTYPGQILLCVVLGEDSSYMAVPTKRISGERIAFEIEADAEKHGKLGIFWRRTSR